MKKFRFPLERLLEVRQQRVLAAQTELHIHVEKQRQAEERVAAAEAEIQGAVTEVRDRLMQSPTATEVIVADTVLRGMHAALATEHTALTQAATTVTQARVVAERRRRDVKIVERLKDRALGVHQTAVAREQEKDTDEMVLERSRRNGA